LICGLVALIGGLIGMMFLRPEREANRFVAGNGMRHDVGEPLAEYR
jgi:hypothetical protein